MKIYVARPYKNFLPLPIDRFKSAPLDHPEGTRMSIPDSATPILAVFIGTIHSQTVGTLYVEKQIVRPHCPPLP